MPGNDLKERVQYFSDWDYNVKVAGVKFRQEELGKLYDEDWNQIKIILEPEPTNEYDPNAVKILANGIHIGYIPAMVAEAFNGLNTEFNKFECALIYITGGDSGKFRTAKVALKEK